MATMELPRGSVVSESTIAARLNASAEAAVGNTAAAMRQLERVDEGEMSAGGARAPYDVFINHRGVDTKHNVAQLLYYRLLRVSGGRVHSFLDNKSMRPGDRLGESIDEGIRQCRVAVAIFSKRYFDSEFCLHELASLVEARKIIIPIFYGIKPSELILPQAVADSNAHALRDIERFRLALQEVKYTVGITYDPATGNLDKLVSKAANAVMERIQETESVPRRRMMIASRL
ncbi:hypothetical protein BAE44_0013004 [Dichanthelium oligosanthes]|uniref:TIR domain-containing protein n=1 Tax=Dichanthelium oligosanthes TaxID=888268 RepID=A0A1E5VLP4_9POAL|nr:hypothetical protein BAE44_0013004 [Dichanthelium oligosanthes]